MVIAASLYHLIRRSKNPPLPDEPVSTFHQSLKSTKKYINEGEYDLCLFGVALEQAPHHNSSLVAELVFCQNTISCFIKLD